MEVFIPFWTIHAAKTSFERNSSLGGGLRPMSTRLKDLEVYFQIDPTSSSDSFGAKNYRQNDVRTSILGPSLLYLVQPTRGPL